MGKNINILFISSFNRVKVSKFNTQMFSLSSLEFGSNFFHSFLFTISQEDHKVLNLFQVCTDKVYYWQKHSRPTIKTNYLTGYPDYLSLFMKKRFSAHHVIIHVSAEVVFCVWKLPSKLDQVLKTMFKKEPKHFNSNILDVAKAF